VAFFSGAFYSTKTITVSANMIAAASPTLNRIANCETGTGAAGGAAGSALKRPFVSGRCGAA
jgi:hypothetical protein